MERTGLRVGVLGGERARADAVHDGRLCPLQDELRQPLVAQGQGDGPALFVFVFVATRDRRDER